MIHDNPALDALLFVAILIPSVVIHEVAHAWLADRFGDPTPRAAGRITANPVPHVDPVGSLLVPTALALAGSTVFGWARPVPISPGHFAHPRRGMALVALAGPASNLGLALLVARLGPFVDVRQAGFEGVDLVSTLGIGLTSDSTAARILFGALVLNAALAVFNLLPIPPLDGSRLVPLALPERLRPAWDRAAGYGLLVLLALVFVFDGALEAVGEVIGGLLRVLV